MNAELKKLKPRPTTVAIRVCQLALFATGIALACTTSHGHLDQTQIPGFLIALSISWWLTPEIRTRAMQLKLVDQPGDPRRIHKVAVPRLGGVAIYISIVVTLVIMIAICGRWPREGGLAGIAAGGTLIFVMGLLDDLDSLAARTKLIIQILAACSAYSLGVRINRFIPLPFAFDLGFIHINYGLDLGQFAFPITVLWLVGISNAVNLIDGMDGLAAGVSAISAVTIWSIAMAPSLHQPYPALIAAVLAGGLMGFLRWNFNPARIFLGDSGAYLTGFILGSMALTGVMKTATVVTVLLPMLILFFPLLDTSWAIVRRLARGQSVFQPDAEHIHHRLLRTGLSQKKVAYLIYLFSAVLGFIACSFVGQQWYYLTVGASLLAMALFFSEVLNRHRQGQLRREGGRPDIAPDEPESQLNFAPERFEGTDEGLSLNKSSDSQTNKQS